LTFETLARLSDENAKRMRDTLNGRTIRGMNAAVGTRTDVCAVVVTYHPTPELAANLFALAPQVAKIVIVDNGSDRQTLARIEAAAEAVNSPVIALGKNFGVAHALNVGLNFAKRNGFRWLATFDQDSKATASMLEDMLRAAGHYKYPDRVAVIAPVHVDQRLGVSLQNQVVEKVGQDCRLLYSTMTSGNLVAVEAASAVGGFDDSLFIDYVDHEFCLRLRQHHFQILEARNVRLLHSLGDITSHRLFRKRMFVTNHPVSRRYYMSRNRSLLWSRYWRSEGAWVRRDLRGFTAELAGIVLFERDRAAKIAMVFKGLFDALRGVNGPLKSST
jgi:rhamnosyltransferase